MRLAWRRRNARSCEITIARAADSSASVSSNHWIDGRSRWLVGSSSSSTSGAASSSFASSTRMRQPPRERRERAFAVAPRRSRAPRARARRAPRARTRPRRVERPRARGRSARRAPRAPRAARRAIARSSSRDLRLERGEIGERLARLLAHRAPDVRIDLLAQQRDAPIARDHDAPLVRRVVPGRDPQQRGLPRAVRPDEPDPVARADGEVHPAEQHPRAEPLPDALEPRATRPGS